MKNHSHLSKETVTLMSERLARILADLHQLYIKSLGFHWNVVSPRFGDLHRLFEDVYTEVNEELDVVAERIRALGKRAPGTCRELEDLRRIKDAEITHDDVQMIEALAQDLEEMNVWLREDIRTAEEVGDPGTADYLVGLLRKFEKRVWILRSYLPSS